MSPTHESSADFDCLFMKLSDCKAGNYVDPPGLKKIPD